MKDQITWINKPNTKAELLKILNPSVKKWFQNKFPSFAPAQKVGVMPIHCRENILISSPTGSGKTLTGFLSIINELVDSAEKGILEDKVYAIYISPLKALGYDIEHNLVNPLKEIEEISKQKLNIRVGVRTGDTSQYQRQKMIKTPPHILITTPESIALMLVSPKAKEILKDVQWSIIDEIHALAENKRGVHLSLMLEHLQHQNPGMARIGLSATVAPLEDVARYLAGTNRPCKIADISATKKLDLKVISPVNDLVNTDLKVINEKQFEKIHELISTHNTTLIFTNTRAATERVVHTLKQKFPKSYYELNENPPFEHASLIGAHHGSLSKQKRFDIEQKLREGKLKCGVCSTSLELGIDIGSIDLVILLGSPKSVARALQRCGRSGHSLNQTTKARIIVLDRDDLIECSVLLKNALEQKIDKIHIPKNSYDVLVQHILGFVLNETIQIKDLYEITKQSYAYRNLKFTKFTEVVNYLAGEYKSLENRYIFAKIYKNEDGTISRKGKMTRMIYTSNLGTIPSSSGITVKQGEYPVGSIDENFLERLKRGDRFVLGGDVYEFRFARGMTAQVKAAFGKSPTIPRWFSESLPLSFDLAKSIQRFRGNSFSYLKTKTKKKTLEWFNKYLYVDDTAALAIYNYFEEEFLYTEKTKTNTFPTNSNFVVEEYTDDLVDKQNKNYLICHSLNGRKANEALSRVFAYTLGKYHHTDIEIGLNDNGFYLASTKKLDIKKVIELLEIDEFEQILKDSIEQSEVLRRRFRQCAERSLMILRNYKGKVKKAGRQQVSSMILLKAARKISEKFIILEETYREVMEDIMDIDNAVSVFKDIKQGANKLITTANSLPSPFATNLVLQGYSDIISIDDRHKFLQNMHKLVLAKISANKKIEAKKRIEIAKKLSELSNVKTPIIKKIELTDIQNLLIEQTKLIKLKSSIKAEIIMLIKGEEIDGYIIDQLITHSDKIKEEWPKELAHFVIHKVKETNQPIDYEDLWNSEAEKEEIKRKTEDFKLKKDLAYAFKRRETPIDIIEQIYLSLDKPKKHLKRKATEYLEEEFKIKINKVWSDRAYNYLKEKLKL